MQSLQAFNPVHPLVIEILEWIVLAKSRGKDIKFCWVPAHVGVNGNERADELAKFAALTLEAKDRPLPNRDLNPIIKTAAFHYRQFSWDLEECNKMKEIATSVSPWKYSMDRRRETALCRLRIGHTCLTHGFLMSRDPPPFCEDCLVPLTVRHLLVECPSL